MIWTVFALFVILPVTMFLLALAIMLAIGVAMHIAEKKGWM